MENCPCGSSRPYDECCGPLLSGDQVATTAEALMRSRYTAYVEKNFDYLIETTYPDQRHTLDRDDMKNWMDNCTWKSLQMGRKEKGRESDKEGVVEFVAHYLEGGERKKHHEISLFRKYKGEWYYEGHQHSCSGHHDHGHHHHHREVTAPITSEKTAGPNDPCPCGSGRKHKKCCMT